VVGRTTIRGEWPNREETAGRWVVWQRSKHSREDPTTSTKIYFSPNLPVPSATALKSQHPPLPTHLLELLLFCTSCSIPYLLVPAYAPDSKSSDACTGLTCQVPRILTTASDTQQHNSLLSYHRSAQSIEPCFPKASLRLFAPSRNLPILRSQKMSVSTFMNYTHLRPSNHPSKRVPRLSMRSL